MPNSKRILYETFGPTFDIIIVGRRSDVQDRNDIFNFTNFDSNNDNFYNYQNYYLNISRNQYLNNISIPPGVSDNILQLLSWFVGDGNTEITLPSAIFTLIYSEIPGATDIKIASDKVLSPSDLINLREIWECRDINEIPSITSANIDKFQKEVIKTIGFRFNSMQRLDNKTGVFYRELEPFKYYKIDMVDGINVYTFSLNPNKYEPMGHCNLSYIHKFEIDIELNPIEDTLITPYTRDLIIYNRYYNVLRVQSGMGELLFNK